MRVLFVINRCKHSYLDYVRALASKCPDNRVVISYIGNDWLGRSKVVKPDRLLPYIDILSHTPVQEKSIDMDAFDSAIRSAIRELDPHIIHVLPYLHDALSIRIRKILAEIRHPAKLVYETRDPTGLMRGNTQEEQQALRAADGFIFVSEEIADYVFNRYGFEPSPNLIVRHAAYYAKRDTEPTKLSSADGNVHVVLMGTFLDHPSSARSYENVIREFVSNTVGTVLHTYPHSAPPYLAKLEKEFAGRFQNHEKILEVTFTDQPKHTSGFGRYDFNLVAYNLESSSAERELLRYTNPVKATTPLILADLPFICSSHYRGLIELIDIYCCGYVYRGWSDLNEFFQQRGRWPELMDNARRTAKELCLESQAPRVFEFYARLAGEN